jgi:hypothetical protein
MRRHPCSFGPLLLAAGMLACAPALAATEIGVTSAVIPAARGKPTDGEARVLQVGLDMQANERVQTDAGGKAQLLFLDGSALSIGPNSDVVLDEYVYDPETKTGKIALSATRGVFRLVGGAISKTTPVTLTTPTATIGVRGGIAMIAAGPQGAEAAFIYGEELFVHGGGETQRVERPGFVIATGPDGTPQPPTPLSQQQVDAQNAAFAGGDAPPPGAPSVSDEDVAQSQVSALNSTVAASDVAPAAGGGAPPPPSSANGNTAEPSQIQMTEIARRAAGAPAGGGQSPGGDSPGEDDQVETPPLGFTLPGVFVGRAKHEHPNGPSTGTHDESLSQNVRLENGSVTNGVFSASGQAAQDFVFALNAAEGAFPATSTQQPFGAGTLTGSGFLTAEQDFLLYTLMDQADGHKVLAFAGVPTPPAAFPTTGVWRYALQDDFVRGQTLPFIEDPQAGLVSLPSAYIAWDDSQPDAIRAFGAGAIVIQGQGAAQQSAGTVLTGVVLDDANGRPFIQGRMNGQRRTGADGAFDPTTLFNSHLSTSDASDGSDFFGATGPRNFVLEASRVDLQDQVQDRGGTRFGNAGNNAAADYFPNTPALLGAPFAHGQRTTRTLNGFAAGLESRYDISGALLNAQDLSNSDPTALSIATSAEQNKVSALFQLAASVDESSVDMQFGNTVGGEAFIDDRRFMALTNGLVTVNGDPNVSGLLAMVTSSELQHDGLLPAGVSFCDCDYLTWGFFFGRREQGPGENRVVELGTWVAGVLSDTNQIVGFTPMTASYSGHVIAGVRNNSSIYSAVGAINMQFTFGGGSANLDSLTISNFDGRNFNFPEPTNQFETNHYFGSVCTTASCTEPSAIRANIAGAFFGPGAPPANTAGSVQFSGANYRGSGTYAAAKLSP